MTGQPRGRVQSPGVVRMAWHGDSSHTDERLVTYMRRDHINVCVTNNGNQVCHCQRKINTER